MVFGRRSTAAVGALCIALTTTSCSNEATGPIAAAAGTSNDTIPAPPFDDLVEATLGGTRSELNIALNIARHRWMENCLSSQGFALRDAAPITDPSLFQPMFYARSTIQRIASGTLTPGPAEVADTENDDAYMVAYQACTANASSEIVDPMAQFYAWYSTKVEEQSQRYQSDPRAQTLQVDYRACIAALGFDASSEQKLRENFLFPVNEIIERYRRGELTRAEAIRELDAIDSLESAQATGLYACDDAHTKANGLIVNDLEQRFIDANEIEINALLEQAADAGQQLLESQPSD